MLCCSCCCCVTFLAVCCRLSAVVHGHEVIYIWYLVLFYSTLSDQEHKNRTDSNNVKIKIIYRVPGQSGTWYVLIAGQGSTGY